MNENDEELLRVRANSINAIQVLHPDQGWRLVGFAAGSHAAVEVSRRDGGYSVRVNEKPEVWVPAVASGEPARIRGALQGSARFFEVRAAFAPIWGTTFFKEADAIEERCWSSAESGFASVGSCGFMLAGNPPQIVYAGETPGCARVRLDPGTLSAAAFDRDIEDLGDVYLIETRFARFAGLTDLPDSNLTLLPGLREDGSLSWAVRKVGSVSSLNTSWLVEVTGPVGVPMVVALGRGDWFRSLGVAVDEGSGRLLVSIEGITVHDATYDPSSLAAVSIALGDLSGQAGEGTGTLTVSEAWVQNNWSHQRIV